MIYVYDWGRKEVRTYDAPPYDVQDAIERARNTKLINDIMLERRSRANDHLTLSAAHRLLGQLADDTLSRETQAECRDVMAKLEKMVGEG